MTLSFNEKLKTVQFNKGLHNQEIGYADLFANRRLLIIAIPVPINMSAWYHMDSYDKKHGEIMQLGIDGVYGVSSSPIFMPYLAKHTKKITPLIDNTLDFVALMAEVASTNTDVNELSRMWEYVAVINNGNLEKCFSNPLKEGMMWAAYNHEKYRFRGLAVETILDYLGNVAQ